MALASNVCRDQTASFNHSGSQINHNGIVTFQSILVVKNYWIASLNGSVCRLTEMELLHFNPNILQWDLKAFH